MDSENQKNSDDRQAQSDLSQIEYLRGLTAIAREENLAELEVEQNGIRITLRRVEPDYYGAPDSYAIAQVAAPAVAEPAIAPGSSKGSTTSEAPQAAPRENLIEIVSPMVGVFYRAPSPADPNFIEIGDKIEVGQTVALVEAMKVFNEILAEASGIVAEIKAASADLVETGQVIITLRAA